MKKQYLLEYSEPGRETTERKFDTLAQAVFTMTNEYFDTLEDETHMAYSCNNEYHFTFNSDSAQLKYSNDYIFTWKIRKL